MTLRSSFRRFTSSRVQNSQRGYLLLTLMLAFAMIAMTQLVVLQNLRHQVQRDREEELCHRGTEYMRAIRRYYRAMGRYPTRLEDLENASGKRFIRRLYKDPLSRDPQTGQEPEFKLLHPQDVMLSNGPLSQQAGSQGNDKWQQAFSGNLRPADSSDAQDQAPHADSQRSDSSETPTATGKPNPTPGKPNPAASAPSSTSNSGFDFEGGAPIIGVASTNKAETIREFNKKNHYDEWYFIYDASVQSVGLLVGPWQPLAAMGTGVASNGGLTNAPRANRGPGVSQPVTNPPQATADPPPSP